MKNTKMQSGNKIASYIFIALIFIYWFAEIIFHLGKPENIQLLENVFPEPMYATILKLFGSATMVVGILMYRDKIKLDFLLLTGSLLVIITFIISKRYERVYEGSLLYDFNFLELLSVIILILHCQISLEGENSIRYNPFGGFSSVSKNKLSV